MLDIMVEEASLWSNLETGGMLFGKIAEGENSLSITIDKTHIPPETSCIRKSSYYEIDPSYAKQILDNESALYLGNWHKHLGYGGPSSGDFRQIEEFFLNNPHLNIILTCILDFLSEDDNELIIEVYKRIDDDSITNEISFQTYRVLSDDISFFTSDSPSLEPISGISSERINDVKQALLEIFDFHFSLNDIDDFPGSSTDERIISFPFQILIDNSGVQEEVDLRILISIPPEFPKGKLFIDLSSKDMSKNITIDKHDADVLNNEELILPFLELLKVNLEDEVPSLLKQPLWKVLNN
jgi:hypothetical protein